MNILNSTIIEAKHDLLWQDSPAMSGGTPKPVLIITHALPAGSAEESQLRKMLDACKLMPEQYNSISLNDATPLAWFKLKQRYNPRYIFMAGISPAQLGIHALFQINTVNHFDDRLWLPTYTLQQLEQHAELKRKLWTDGMKPLFVDKIYG